MNQKQLKAVLADALQRVGYKAVKGMLYRKQKNVFTVIDLQKSRFAGRYYVNVGVFVDESGLLDCPPPFHQTHLMHRLEAIVPRAVCDSLLPALDLELPMRADVRSGIITNALELYGLPYLDSLSTIEGIVDFLRPEKGNYAGVTQALREIADRSTRGDGKSE